MTVPMTVPPTVQATPLPDWIRRPLAYGLDVVILTGLGTALSLALWRPLLRLGPWTVLVGLLPALAYFGLLNGRPGRGQTLGKRLLGLKVVDASGRAIGVGRAVLRALPLLLPSILSRGPGQVGGLAASPLLTGGVGVVTFGFWAGLLYFYAFNRQTRQSIHDFLAGTYVVRADHAGPVDLPPVARKHFVWGPIIAGVVALAVVILPALVVVKSADLQKLSAAGVAVQEMTGFRVLQLNHGVVFSSEGQTQTVSITVAAKQALPTGTGDQPPAEILEVARALFDSYPPASEAGFVVVRFSAYIDLVFGKTFRSVGWTDEPAGWRAFFGEADGSTGEGPDTNPAAGPN